MQVEAYNHALRGIPEDRVRYHLCWGSMNTPHTSDVPLKDIVDLILKINAQAYSIEAANPRHEHEWMVWKDVKLPEGKILIPGVISHQTNVVEHPELVAWRIKNYASVVGKRECHRQHGLRLRARLEHDPRPPGGAVGEAGCSGRRRQDRLARSLEIAAG